METGNPKNQEYFPRQLVVFISMDIIHLEVM
jgi:hypothetical protein